MAAAREQGVPVPVSSRTTETQKVFANPDGTFTFTQNAQPVRARKPRVGWKPIDPALSVSADGRVRPQVTALDMSFSNGDKSPVGGVTELVTLTDHDKSLTMSWNGPLPQPELSGNSAIYREVLDGVDLIVRAEANAFSEILSIKTPTAAKNAELAKLTFPLKAEGVKVETDPEGALRARDEDGHVIFAGPRPTMWDSSGVAAPPDVTGAVRAESVADSTAEPNADGRVSMLGTEVTAESINLIPDQALLNNPDAIYPINIDPRWGAGIRTDYTWVYSRFPSQSYWGSKETARVGKEGETSGTARSLFRMATDGVRGKQILKATLQTKEVHAWSCLPRPVSLWETGGIDAKTTWNHQPAWVAKLSTNNVAHGYSGNCPARGVDFDMTGLVTKAASNGWPNVTVGLRADNESDIFGWKKFNNNPTLSVEYDSYPRVPANAISSPATGCANGVLGVTDITLRAVPHDDDGGTVTAEFQLWRSGGDTINRAVNVTSGNPASTVIKKDLLIDGATYGWHVRTTATGDSSSWTKDCTFKVDKTSPVADVIVMSTAFPEYGADKIVSPTPAGVPGQFTLDAQGNVDVLAFWVGIGATDRYIKADKAGGKATLYLTPTSPGPMTVYVQTVDAANNRSLTLDTDYTFFTNRRVSTSDNAHDYNGDGNSEIFARSATGDIKVYLGDGSGSSLAGGVGVPIDSNRVGYRLFSAGGDWDGDDRNDVMAISSTGALVYHRGNGAGGYDPEAIAVYGDSATGVPIVYDPAATALGVGDFDGDDAIDLFIRSYPKPGVPTDFLVHGDGRGHLLNDGAHSEITFGQTLKYSKFAAAGDVDRDGWPDLVAVTAAGDMSVLRGNGHGGLAKAGVTPPVMDVRPVFGGWQSSRRIWSPGDWNGDGLPDILAVAPNGNLDGFYRNTANPRFFASATQVGTGWSAYEDEF